MIPTFFFKQQDMFNHADTLQHSFLFAKDTPTGSKCYASLPNTQEFLNFYTPLPNTQKNFYELIRTDTPFYEYYDLDLKPPENYDPSVYNEHSLFSWFENIRFQFLQSQTPSFDALDKFMPKWTITTASNRTKLSLHILNKNTIFPNHTTFKSFYNLFKNYINNFSNPNHPFHNAIDFCVSSNNRCMRITQSSKINSDRPLTLWNDCESRHLFKNPTIIDTFITNPTNHPNITTQDFTQNTPQHQQKHNEICNEICNEISTINHSTELIEKLLTILSPQRYNSYEDWIKIGMALKNKNDSLFPLWDNWSKQSPKYTQTTQNIWNNFSTNHKTPLTLGTIHYFAKQDNPQKYKEIISQHSHININTPFTPTKIISHKYIPPEIYSNNILKYNVIALKSNMNTGKTYGMPVIFKDYTKILIIYHRISLNVSIYEKWQQYGFELYSDIPEHKINLDKHPKIICQIDSIHRIIGKIDLLILDEIESTHEHLCGSKTLNETDKCSKSLLNYIKYTPKIIACDANLKDETCDILFHQKNLIKIQNTYKSFQHRTCHIYHSKENLIEKLYELIDSDKNIVIPTNSKKQGKKLEKLLKNKYEHIKILRIDSENGFTTIDDWEKYNIVIYTPTITAGISFDKLHFHSLVGFFSNKSASAEQCSQMLFRSRNLINNNLFIYIHNDNQTQTKPINDSELNHYIQNIIFDGIKIEGIDIDNYNKKMIETTYYKLYRFFLKKINLSFDYFCSYMIQILKDHGLTIYNISPKVKDFDIYHNIIDAVKNASIQIETEEAENICKATPINEEDYTTLINSKTQRTKEENDTIKRHILTNTFDIPHNSPLEIDWVKHNIKYYMGYKHFKLFKDDTDILVSIEKCKRIIEKIKENENTKYNNSKLLTKSPNSSSEDEKEEYVYKKKTISKKIHQEIYRDRTFEKIYHCLIFIKEAGFNSLSDTAKIKVDYPTIRQYCRENEKRIRGTFERSKMMEWGENELEANEKNALSKYVNQKLESCLGIRITPTSKGSLKYEIKSLFIL
jgi:hypothetical protein